MDEESSKQAMMEAVAAEIKGRGITQAQLGEMVAETEGRPLPYPQNTVGDWLTRRRGITPARVFAIETALGLPPSTISRLGGYRPLAEDGPCTVAHAIASDPALTPKDRRSLLAMYHVFIEGDPDDGSNGSQ